MVPLALSQQRANIDRITSGLESLVSMYEKTQRLKQENHTRTAYLQRLYDWIQKLQIQLQNELQTYTVMQVAANKIQAQRAVPLASVEERLATQSANLTEHPDYSQQMRQLIAEKTACEATAAGMSRAIEEKDLQVQQLQSRVLQLDQQMQKVEGDVEKEREDKEKAIAAKLACDEELENMKDQKQRDLQQVQYTVGEKTQELQSTKKKAELLQTSLQEKDALIQSLQDDAQLRSTIQNKENEIERLSENTQELQSTKEKAELFQTSLQEKEAVIESLQTQLQVKAGQLKVALEIKEIITAKNDQFKKQIQQLEQNAQSLEVKSKEALETNQLLEQKIRDLESKPILQEFDEVELKSKRQEVANLKSQVEKLQAENESLKSQCAPLESMETEESVTELERKNEELMQKNQQLQSELKEKMGGDFVKQSEIETRLIQKAEENAQLKAELAELKKPIEGYLEKVAGTDKLLTQKAEENAQLKAELAELNKKMGADLGKQAETDKLFSRISDENAQCKSQIDRLNRDLQTLQERNQLFTEMEQRTKELATKFDECTAEAAQVREQYETILQRNEEKIKQLTLINETQGNQIANLPEIEKKLEECDKLIEGLRTDLEICSRTNTDLNAEVERNHNAQLERNVQDEKQKEEAYRLNLALQNENEWLRTQLRQQKKGANPAPPLESPAKRKPI
jgi:chromosome segregation ATPase